MMNSWNGAASVNTVPRTGMTSTAEAMVLTTFGTYDRTSASVLFAEKMKA